MKNTFKNSFLSAAIFLLYAQVFAQTPKPKLHIKHLTGNLYTYITYHRMDNQWVSANALYLVTNKGAVMMDTPWDPEEYQPMLDSIQKKHHQKVVMCIGTHYHDDRSGGFDFMRKKGIKTWSSAKTKEYAKKYGAKQAQYTFKSDTTFNIGGHTFQTVYAGEGHTRDNIAIWFPKEKVLYGGCLVKSSEADNLGYIDEANLQAWPNTIKALQKRFADARYVIPGHDGGTGVNALSNTLKLLKEKK